MSPFLQQMSFLSDVELEPETVKWLEGLKEGLRPVALARSFPRVANRIAFLWREPQLLRRYFDELTFAEDPGRKGFTQEVMLEIGSLRNVYERMHPAPQDPWHKATVMPEVAHEGAVHSSAPRTTPNRQARRGTS